MWKLKKTPVERLEAILADALKIDAYLKREIEKVIHESISLMAFPEKNTPGAQSHFVFRVEQAKEKIKINEKIISDAFKQLIKINPDYLAPGIGTNPAKA